MKYIIELAYWLYCVIYAFMYWGFLWGLLNIIVPFAPIYDLVIWLIKVIGKI